VTDGQAAPDGQYRAVLDVLSDATFIVNKAAAVRHANHHAERLFASALDELAGRPFNRLFAAQDREALTEFLGQPGKEAVPGRRKISVAFPGCKRSRPGSSSVRPISTVKKP